MYNKTSTWARPSFLGNRREGQYFPHASSWPQLHPSRCQLFWFVLTMLLTPFTILPNLYKPWSDRACRFLACALYRSGASILAIFLLMSLDWEVLRLIHRDGHTVLYPVSLFYSTDCFYHNVFIHSPTDTWLVYKFPAMNKAAVNILYVSRCAHIDFVFQLSLFLLMVYN